MGFEWVNAICYTWNNKKCGEIAYSILVDSSPVKAEGWSAGQQITAAISQQIARAGAPRCCKRDSRIAVYKAAELFNEALGLGLSTSYGISKCDLFEINKVCIPEQYPFFIGLISNS